MNKKQNKNNQPKGYIVRLSFWMVCALVDIDLNYIGKDSSRHHKRTMKALEKRGLVRGQILTKKGQSYLNMAFYEYNLNASKFGLSKVA